MLEEFKVSTVEQKTLIFEVFDRVSRLQNLVVSEVSWLYTVSSFKMLFFQMEGGFFQHQSSGDLLLCLPAGDLPGHIDKADRRCTALAFRHSYGKFRC